MSEEYPIESLDGFEELAAVIRPETPEKPTTGYLTELYSTAADLIKEDGKNTKINGIKHKVTREFSKKRLGNDDIYVRLAMSNDKKDDTIYIVFDETPDITGKTNLISALSLRFDGKDAALMRSDGEDVDSNEPEYIELAKNIIGEIQDKIALKQAKRDKLKPWKFPSRLYNYYTDDTITYNYWLEENVTHGQNRRWATAGAMAVLAACYSHLFYTNVDANIGSIPLPQPIEGFVDWSNWVDHKATGFDTPEGATQVEVGDIRQPIALLTDYDVDGAPRTAYRNGENVYNEYLESKDGLYRQGIPVNPDSFTQEEFYTNEETGCYIVRASLADPEKPTYVFTLSPEIAETVVVSGVDEDTIELCPIEGETFESITPGNIFIYREH